MLSANQHVFFPKEKKKKKRKKGIKNTLENLQRLTLNIDDPIDIIHLWQQHAILQIIDVASIRNRLLLSVFIGKYIEEPLLVYYFLGLCFIKYQRHTAYHQDAKALYFKALKMMIRLILNVCNYDNLIKKIFFELVKDESILSYKERLYLINDLLLSILQIMKKDLQTIHKTNRRMLLAGNYLLTGLDYVKFLNVLYFEWPAAKKSNQAMHDTTIQRMPFYTELTIYIAYKEHHFARNKNREKERVNIELFEQKIWMEFYLIRYQKVTAFNYQPSYPGNDITFKNFLTTMVENWKRGDLESGLILVWIRFSGLADDAEQEVVPFDIETTQDILAKLMANEYKIEKNSIFEEIPVWFLKTKELLDKNKDKAIVDFDRKTESSLLITFLDALYAIGNKAAGLMLVQLAPQYVVAIPGRSERYEIDLPEAAAILNELITAGYETKECEKVLKEIKDLENENLSDTDEGETSFTGECKQIVLESWSDEETNEIKESNPTAAYQPYGGS